MNRHGLIVITLIFALDACSASELATAQGVLAAAPADIQAGCKAALSAADLAANVVKGGAANTVGEIAAGVVVGCTTADGVAKLAADASSVDWLGQQAGTLKAIATGQTASGT